MATKTKTKTSVDMVRDTVAAMNEADAAFGGMCRKLAAAGVVFLKHNGGDKPAMNQLVVMLDGLASKSTRKHICAWLPKGFLAYEEYAGIHADAEKAVAAVLGAFGEVPWRTMREEFRVARDPKPGKGPVKEQVTDGTRKALPEAAAVPAGTVEVLPIRPVEQVLALLEGMDNDALADVILAANAILTARAENAAQAEPVAEAA